MADNFAQYYTGNMAPPLKLPGGGYAPAPSAQTQMTPEEIYQGIYGEPLTPSGGLTSRPVKTVAIDPMTGMPPRPQVAAAPLPTAQPGMYGRGQPMPLPPNQPSGSIALGKDQSRLTQNAFGYGTNGAAGGNAATAAIDGATAKTGLQQVPYGVYMNNRSRDSLDYAAQGRRDLLRMLEDQQNAPIDLTSVNPRNPQAMADTQGKAVRVGNTVYYPGGKAPAGRGQPVSQQMAGQQRQSGLGGLLAGLFGGGQGGQPQQGGGGLGGLLSGMGGGSAYGSSPSQGQAMIVSPGTSTGSVLSGMGFSDGAAVPAATIRALNDRGYF